jgi:hypothetical protein
MTYYFLPTDSYGQPRGYVEEVDKTWYELALANNTPYLYTDYIQALTRAQD